MPYKFIQSVAAFVAGLQTVDHADTQKILFIDTVNFIKVVEVLTGDIGVGDVGVVQIRLHHMAQPVDFKETAADILPGAVDLGGKFHAEFSDHPHFGTAFLVVIDQIMFAVALRIGGIEKSLQILVGNLSFAGV